MLLCSQNLGRGIFLKKGVSDPYCNQIIPLLMIMSFALELPSSLTILPVVIDN